MDILILSNVNLGSTVPSFHRVSEPVWNGRGIWLYFDITYRGGITMTIETKVNLMKLRQPEGDEEDLDNNGQPIPMQTTEPLSK